MSESTSLMMTLVATGGGALTVANAKLKSEAIVIGRIVRVRIRDLTSHDTVTAHAALLGRSAVGVSVKLAARVRRSAQVSAGTAAFKRKGTGGMR